MSEQPATVQKEFSHLSNSDLSHMLRDVLHSVPDQHDYDFIKRLCNEIAQRRELEARNA